MAGELIVPLPSEHELGPAMKVLNEQQRAFVVAYVVMGANATAAARAAGYAIGEGANPASQRVQAYRLIHDTRVQAAITEEAARRLKGMVPAALQAVQETIENPQHKDRLKASFGVLNRAGLHEVAERNVNVNVSLTHAQKIERIKVLAEKLGADPKILLGNCVDAEFEEVPTDENGESW